MPSGILNVGERGFLCIHAALLRITGCYSCKRFPSSNSQIIERVYVYTGVQAFEGLIHARTEENVKLDLVIYVKKKESQPWRKSATSDVEKRKKK